MNKIFKITSLKMYPERNGLTQVLVKVDWQIEFEHAGFTSTAACQTLLGEPDANTFTPLAHITKQQLLDWVINIEGGQSFINTLEEFHAHGILRQVLDANTLTVVLPFVEPPVQQQVIYNLEQVG